MRLAMAGEKAVDPRIVWGAENASRGAAKLDLGNRHRNRRYLTNPQRRWQSDVMAILVDTPRWWFRGRRWSHLVSDTSLDELHAFAERVGIPRRGFQGDHYDVPEEHLDDLLGAGAELVDSRVLLRRLRDAGLRLSPAERRARQPTC
jgi:hypothetical protein